MEQYFLSFFLRSFVMTAIIAIVLLINTIAGKKFPAKQRYILWLVIVIGFLLPISPVFGSGIIKVSISLFKQTPNYFNFFVLLSIWVITAALIFLWHIWRYVRFKQTVHRWGVNITDEKILSVFRSVQIKQGLENKKIDLKVCDFISSSMLIGFRYPVILLPNKDFDTDELELIFAHELIHFKRYDIYIKLLLLITISLHWFNPLVYWMCQAIQTDCESSCDEEVLSGYSKENRQFYAEIIVGMAGKKDALRTILSTSFFYPEKYSIKKRLDSIMDMTKKKKLPAMVVLTIITVLVTFSGSVFAITVPDISMPESANTAPDFLLSVSNSIEIALARTGGGMVEEIEFEQKDGMRIYDIKIRKDHSIYEIEIDTATGNIIEFKEDLVQTLAHRNIAPSISFNNAIEIAISMFKGGILEEIELEYDENVLIYEAKIKNDNRLLEVKIDAITGEIIGIEPVP